MASKYDCLHCRANFELVSEDRGDGRAAIMLECQSRHVPIKSKRTALTRLSLWVTLPDMFKRFLV